jgi:histidyl-tRNA synthetase
MLKSNKMNKLQTLKGFRDFLPQDTVKRQWIKDKMIQTAKRWGYEPIETPTLEPYSLFKGEIGEDEKLFYKFIDLGGREVMLRYDQTVPTCRYVAANQNSLSISICFQGGKYPARKIS